MQEYLLLLVIVFIASVIQGVTGFGFSMIVMSLLPLFIPLKDTAVIVAVYSCFSGGFMSYKLRNYIDFKLVLIPFLASIISVWGGVYLLLVTPEKIIKPILGIIIIIMTVFLFVISKREITVKINTKNGIMSGLISGLMSGAFNIGGPPLVVYYVHAAKDKLTYKASLDFTYFMTSLVVIISHIILGNFKIELLGNTLIGLLGVLIGSLVGLELLKILKRSELNQWVYVILFLSGLYLIFK